MRIIGLIQARMNSIRLPGKILKEINSLPLIVHIYRRLLACKELDGIVASVACAGGEKIQSTCWKYGFRNVSVFPWQQLVDQKSTNLSDGSIRVDNSGKLNTDDDLLTRHLHSMPSDGNAFVRITADCLWHDPLRIDSMVRDYRLYYPRYLGFSNKIPYRTVSEVLDAEIVSMELLAQLDRDPNCPRETFCTYAEEKGYLAPWPIMTQHRYPIGEDLHLSIDTQEDLDRAEEMLKWLGSNDRWNYEETMAAYRGT